MYDVKIFKLSHTQFKEEMLTVLFCSALPYRGTEAGVIVGVVLATAALVLIATAGIILGALTLCYCRRKTKRCLLLLDKLPKQQ